MLTSGLVARRTAGDDLELRGRGALQQIPGGDARRQAVAPGHDIVCTRVGQQRRETVVADAGANIHHAARPHQEVGETINHGLGCWVGTLPIGPPHTHHQYPVFTLLVGGAFKLLDKPLLFQQAGLGDAISSWIGGGPNQHISPDQMTSALGEDTISQIAAQLGLSQGEAAGQLSQLLPEVIDHLTPAGRAPGGGLGDSGDLMGMLDGLIKRR